MPLTRCSCVWLPRYGGWERIVTDPDCHAPHEGDPRPQPGDAPQYHDDLAFWLQRHPEAK